MDRQFEAIVLQEEDGKTISQIRKLSLDQLPEGEVTVKIAYSSLNYKDALAIKGAGKIVRKFPMVPGIDFSGTVEHSSTSAYKPGDKVILTGWSVGEKYWGGLSQLQRVKASWLVPLPGDLDERKAMIVGTAGYTAMLCLQALQQAGLHSGKILVSGAKGGVGSMAVSLLSAAGYEVHALTQNPEENGDYLKSLGAAEVIGGEQWRDKPAPLSSATWDGAIDVVGGNVLARILSEMKYGGVVAACGLAGGHLLSTTVMPFILRGVRLIGIDSVMTPFEPRKRAWQQLSALLPSQAYQQMVHEIGLSEVEKTCEGILAGTVRGRVIVKLH